MADVMVMEILYGALKVFKEKGVTVCHLLMEERDRWAK
jgi:hypothetical protein